MSPLLPGQRIGGYTIQSLIAQGGMGTVYRAKHVSLGHDVAIKVLHDRSFDLTARFIQEGRLQANLRHTNIVSVHDLLVLDGHPALVMDYVHGPTLGQYIRRENRPHAALERIFRDIVVAVGRAHDEGIVHRDLKPANVLMSFAEDAPTPKVTDFGIAKIMSCSARMQTSSHGQIMGTPCYMAPEQLIDTASVDQRADLYALGCILYEMFCGSPPVTERGLRLRYQASVEELWDPPQERCPTLPVHIRNAIYACLAGDSANRVSSCDALLKILDAPTQVGAMNPGRQPTQGDFLDSERYRLIEKMHGGNYLQMWRSYDRVDRRTVTIHILDHTLVDDVQVCAELFERVRRIMRLGHPLIIEILREYVEDKQMGCVYFVTEYLWGGDLYRATLEGRLTEEEVVRSVHMIGFVLQDLHENNLLHLNVSPQTILLTEDGYPKLTGFDLVSPGPRKGTTFTAPETTSEAGQIDARADLYSLGITLIFCLRGYEFSSTERTVLLRSIDWDPQFRFCSVQDFCEQFAEASQYKRRCLSVYNMRRLNATHRIFLRGVVLPIFLFALALIGLTALMVWH